MAHPKFRILCLGGGATNLTLMSGALHRLHEAGLYKEDKRPNVITMAGAGAVVGLHYLAPKGMKSTDPAAAQLEALENTVNFGVSDAIYEMFPVNYKVFTKSGPAADLFNEFWSSLPEVQEAMHQSKMSDDEVLLSDSLLFAGAAVCPTDVNFFSQGICGHSQFLEELIDFEALNRIDPNDIELEINAFCIEDHEIVDFTNYERDAKGRPITVGNNRYVPRPITADHLRAALAFPFLHAPYKIGDKHYFEGAAIQCLNDYTVHDAQQIDWFLVLDPLRKNMVGIPQNLWDAFALSIIMPTAGLTELGRMILELKRMFEESPMTKTPQFKAFADSLKAQPRDDQRLLSAFELLIVALASPHTHGRLYLSEFKVAAEQVPRAWGWSRSSLKDLFAVGQRAGTDLVNEMRKYHDL
jgi:NTE family protein